MNSFLSFSLFFFLLSSFFTDDKEKPKVIESGGKDDDEGFLFQRETKMYQIGSSKDRLNVEEVVLDSPTLLNSAILKSETAYVLDQVWEFFFFFCFLLSNLAPFFSFYFYFFLILIFIIQTKKK